MHLVVCVLTHITLHGGPEKWQKRGRAKRVLSHFCHVYKNVMFIFEEHLYACPSVPGDSLFNSTLFIHSPYQTGSQPMSGR